MVHVSPFTTSCVHAPLTFFACCFLHFCASILDGVCPFLCMCIDIGGISGSFLLPHCTSIAFPWARRCRHSFYLPDGGCLLEGCNKLIFGGEGYKSLFCDITLFSTGKRDWEFDLCRRTGWYTHTAHAFLGSSGGFFFWDRSVWFGLFVSWFDGVSVIESLWVGWRIVILMEKSIAICLCFCTEMWAW